MHGAPEGRILGMETRSDKAPVYVFYLYTLHIKYLPFLNQKHHLDLETRSPFYKTCWKKFIAQIAT